VLLAVLATSSAMAAGSPESSDCGTAAATSVVSSSSSRGSIWKTITLSRGANRGRGLPLMRGLMESVDVEPADGGTSVVMRRTLAGS